MASRFEDVFLSAVFVFFYGSIAILLYFFIFVITGRVKLVEGIWKIFYAPFLLIGLAMALNDDDF